MNCYPLLFACAFGIAATGQVHAAEIRICESEIRSSPLSDDRGVESALVQGFAVINSGLKAEKLVGVAFHLKDKGKSRDWRWLLPPDIARAVAQAPHTEILERVFPSQFCKGEMLGGAKFATSDVLAPGEAIIFMHQPFVWSGARDQLVITASTERNGAPYDAKKTIPIVTGASKNELLFPIAGRSFVSSASGFHTAHRWASSEEFAYDIVMLADKGATYRGKGTKLSDYAAFGKPVRAAASGRVVATSDGTSDNADILKLVGERDKLLPNRVSAYWAKIQADRMALMTKGLEAKLGNHVVIDHGNREFSIYAHIKKGSIRVKVGDALNAGDTIAALGSSGDSTEPHLHFQICGGPDRFTCHSIPANFTGYRLPFELTPRSIQSGDLVEAD